MVQALRLGDVKKALRLLCSAPLAKKGPDTLRSLEALHPRGPSPPLVQPAPTPRFSFETVSSALFTFGPGSAGGLFGYTPFLIQQCFRAESWSFPRALVEVVNHLASGEPLSSSVLFCQGVFQLP